MFREVPSSCKEGRDYIDLRAVKTTIKYYFGKEQYLAYMHAPKTLDSVSGPSMYSPGTNTFSVNSSQVTALLTQCYKKNLLIEFTHKGLMNTFVYLVQNFKGSNI